MAAPSQRLLRRNHGPESAEGASQGAGDGRALRCEPRQALLDGACQARAHEGGRVDHRRSFRTQATLAYILQQTLTCGRSVTWLLILMKCLGISYQNGTVPQYSQFVCTLDVQTLT